jgi:hypothetical protein
MDRAVVSTLRYKERMSVPVRHLAELGHPGFNPICVYQESDCVVFYGGFKLTRPFKIVCIVKVGRVLLAQ